MKKILRAELRTKCKKTKMYNQRPINRTSMQGAQPNVGEDMITKMSRIMTSGEPIKDTANKVYQTREEGVNPLTNIKTDRFELATEATGKNANDVLTKRADILKAKSQAEKPAKPGSEITAS